MLAYNNVNQEDVRRLDRELCAVASAVCPKSRRIAQYLVQESDCLEEKITIIPSTTRSTNVRRQPPQGPEQLPPTWQTSLGPLPAQSGISRKAWTGFCCSRRSPKRLGCTGSSLAPHPCRLPIPGRRRLGRHSQEPRAGSVLQAQSCTATCSYMRELSMSRFSRKAERSDMFGKLFSLP
jgi:hypothetical protein